MVWALFPADPRSGEEKYYIFAKGTYKVGRKGCDVTISNDKGVSRVHAEIVVEAMENGPSNLSSNVNVNVKIRDCSKYGTLVTRNSSTKEKVHECPGRELYLREGDLVSFGTGNATYRFCYVPLIFYLCQFTSTQVTPSTQDRVASIGACVSHTWTTQCTHVIVDPFMPVTEEMVDAIVTRTPLVLSTWLEFIAVNRICNNIPSWTSYTPTLTLDGASVVVADAGSRGNCLKGYTFLLNPATTYRFGDRTQLLLEVAGAKVNSVEEFDSSSQDLENVDGNRLVLVTTDASADQSHHRSSLSKINETNLVCAVISGNLDPSAIISPSVVISSSCSTDETVVADSDVETETATSNHQTAANPLLISTNDESENHEFKQNDDLNTSDMTQINVKQWNKTTVNVKEDKQPVEYECKAETSEDYAAYSLRTDRHLNFVEPSKATVRKKEYGSECGNGDILYSRNLIVKQADPQASIASVTDDGVINFKRFRKTSIQSGNSFSNLVPFSKHPYSASIYDNEANEFAKEEKKRKKMEAKAEDLFSNEVGRRRAVAGSVYGLLRRG